MAVVASPSPVPIVSPSPVAAVATQWTLADVKRIALEQNPDLRSARANYEAASKTILQAISGYLPHIDLNARFDETTLPRPSAGLTDLLGIPTPYLSATASVTQTIFDFGKVLSKIFQAQSQTRSAEQEALAVREAVQFSAEKAYYGVSASQKLVEVAEQSLLRFQETLRRTEVLVRTGARPSFDLTQANVELSKAKLSLIGARNTYEISKITLLDILGFKDQIPFVLLEQEPAPAPSASSLALGELSQIALRSRPEIHQSEANVDAARYALSAQNREYFPTFAFQGWYGTYQPDYPVALRNAWGVGVGATWHVFDGLENYGKASELASRLDQREILFDREREVVQSEVARSYMDYVRSEHSLEVANEALSFAQENSSLAKKRYDASVSTILELLVADTSLVNAEASAIQARYEHAISLAQLKVAVGGSFSEKKGESK
ncbi:MAG: TolC family protein [Bdellovibrionota bacterium]